MSDLLEHFAQRIELRETAIRAYWEHEHGPFDPPGSYPGHPRPYCYDCAGVFLYANPEIPVETIRPATTFFDAYEARYVVCERHWRARMRGAGYSDRALKKIMVNQGGFSPADAAAALRADRESLR